MTLSLMTIMLIMLFRAKKLVVNILDFPFKKIRIFKLFLSIQEDLEFVNIYFIKFNNFVNCHNYF